MHKLGRSSTSATCSSSAILLLLCLPLLLPLLLRCNHAVDQDERRERLSKLWAELEERAELAEQQAAVREAVAVVARILQVRVAKKWERWACRL